MTALKYAIDELCYETVWLLLEEGADPNLNTTSDGIHIPTALDDASKKNKSPYDWKLEWDWEIMELLLKHGKIHTFNFFQESYLF